MKNFWVKGVLEKSLHQQVLISLGLEERPEAIASPWNLMLGSDERSPRELPPGTSVISVFEQIGAGRTLLILGEPGSGKTISLLQLARDLIDRAEQDVDQLIPVIFNLSSWTKSTQRQPLTLADWLVAELNNKYQVPKRLAKDWVEQQHLRLLLDGLDEVRAENRNACVAAINDFQQEQGTEVVVCSRIKDYENLTHRLNFQSAIYLKPLTQSQIHHYLTRLQTDLTGLRSLLSKDTALQELAHSPLMLNIMVLAYQGVALEDLPETNVVEERRKQLFNTYIQRMFDRPSRSKSNSRYSQAQTLHWLRWLAKRMVQKSPTIFLIENMQPSWLLRRRQKGGYRLIFVSIYSLIFGLGFGLVVSLYISWIVGLIVGIIVGLDEEIKPIETLHWSWRRINCRLFPKLIPGVVLGLLAGLSALLLTRMVFAIAVPINLVDTVYIGVCGLIGGLIAGLTNVLIGTDIETRKIPNQGIWQSLRNAGLFGLLIGLFPGLIASLFLGLIYGVINGLFYGLLFGLGLVLVSGLGMGGKACIQHFALRFICYRNGYISWNYARFLTYCTDRLFLQKVGGGYIFVHRLLMEHFAQMEIEK